MAMRRRLRPAAALPLLLALALAAPAATARDKVVLASPLEQHNNYAGQLIGLIYAEAFRQLDVELEIRSFPAQRASAEAVAGNVDGEVARGYEYAGMQSTMLRVDEPVLEINTSAFTRDPALRLQGWDSLRGSDYKVEHRAGYPVIRAKLEAVVAPGRLSAVVNTELGLRKLALGRTDLYIDNDESVLPLLPTTPFRNGGIRKAGVMERTRVYCYLNRRLQPLVPRLAEVLKHMRSSGKIEQLRAAALEAERKRCADPAGPCGAAVALPR